MTHLPYLPHPYPDELLGSWLCRIALHNGQGAWRALLEFTGYASKISRPHFDLVDHDDNFERLINALGTNYGRVIKELTTLPYWLAFDADSSKEVFLTGTNDIPRIFRLPGQKEIRSICFLGVDRKAGKSLRPRCCPQCLEQDYKVYGEPYWHRSHQLPNVFYCHKHYEPLLTSCPKCKRDIVSISTRLIDLPRLKCPCGHNLLISQPVSPLPDKIFKLIDVSVRALNNVKFGWHHEHVRAYLRSHLEGRADTLAKSYQSTLSNELNFKNSPSSALLTSAIRGHGSENYVMSLRNTFGFGKAPECCALLAALDIDFDSAERALEQVTSIERKRRWPEFPTAKMTVKSARRELLIRVQRFPNRHVGDHRNLYWFLRINDSEWMQKRFPEKSPRKFSGISDDRKSLIRLFSDTSLPPYDRKRNAISTVAWVRANIRDKEWLADQLDRLLLAHRLRVIDDRHNNLEQRASDIANAIRALSDDSQKPRQIRISQLAAMVCLTRYQVSTTMRDYPYVRKAFMKANKNYCQRRLLWASRQLLSEGVPLSSAGIHERAELKNNGKNSELVRKIIDTSRYESVPIAVKRSNDTNT